ncbi:unnamed protein product, partial [marine sediment metagenome]
DTHTHIHTHTQHTHYIDMIETYLELGHTHSPIHTTHTHTQHTHYIDT